MKIAGFIKTSLVDWPGKIVSVVFVPGCNFRCPFCHNSHLVDRKKTKKIKNLSEKSIFEELAKRKEFIDGVVISGGEPTLQPDLAEFLEKCQRLGLETMIETNGSNPENLEGILNFKFKILNFIALDFKGPLDNRYARVVGLKNFEPEIWIKSLKIILSSGIPFELRTTVVPGIHNGKILTEMAGQLKKIIENYKLKIENYSWYLQNFQPQNCLKSTFEKIKPFSKIKLEEFSKAIKKIIPKVKICD